VIDIYFDKNENENNYENENKEVIKILRVSNNYPASIRYIEKLLYYKKENITIQDLMNQ
jgi:hypothetical protein